MGKSQEYFEKGLSYNEVYIQGIKDGVDNFMSRLETVSFSKTQWDLIKIISKELKS